MDVTNEIGNIQVVKTFAASTDAADQSLASAAGAGVNSDLVNRDALPDEPTRGAGHVEGSDREVHDQVAPHDDGPRAEVIQRLLADGPSTAVHLAAALGVSGTAVRRHLDALAADGSVSSRQETVAGRRGRGRPARVYLLTDLGRSRLPHAYDELAEDALAYLAEHGGSGAVTAFARRRAERIVDGVRDELSAADTVAARARILAQALSQSGFVANVREIGIGEQLSQHHCPVSHVAAKYPQLCEQELAVFTDALGTYAQRLATIARGDAYCTTFIPDPAHDHTGNEATDAADSTAAHPKSSRPPSQGRTSR